jgi:putative nucleotidyltransferase with HDIG domain
MKVRHNQYNPQPLTAILMSVLALISLVAFWRNQPAIVLDPAGLQTGILAIFLATAVVGAGLRPIHIRHNIKVVITTVPLYIAAMLLPPAVAALTAGASTLLVQFLARSQRGNTPSDIATATSRWVIIAFLSASIAQYAIANHRPLPQVLLSVAVLMFACDTVTGALEIAPMSGESPLRVIAILLREASLSEGAQYLLGILATLAALQQPWSLALWVLPLCIVYGSFKHAKEMHDGTSRLLESLADAVDLRDAYTGGHSRRVTEFTTLILHELGTMGPEVELIRTAARVHDIGKIGIPDHILNKAGQLSVEEKCIMDSHPDRGADLLARYQDFARGRDIVRHHHERWDGEGYPAGLKGLDIPFGARVIAVADSFDAMTSDRPYRAGMPIERAARILHEGRDRQWDATIVDAFLRCLDQEAPQSIVATITVSAVTPAA